ncbi:unnamed protein product [Urochloa humidicola]
MATEQAQHGFSSTLVVLWRDLVKTNSPQGGRRVSLDAQYGQGTSGRNSDGRAATALTPFASLMAAQAGPQALSSTRLPAVCG